MAAGDKLLLDSDVTDKLLLDSDVTDVLLLEAAGVGGGVDIEVIQIYYQKLLAGGVNVGSP